MFYRTVFPSLVSNQVVLASHQMSLNQRYTTASVNNVFRNNILLTLAYMTGRVTDPATINWDEINKPFRFDYILYPGEVFAFHDDVYPFFKHKHIKTTNAHFNAQEGFLTDGLLYGDGVCHLASLIKWAAIDANLAVVAPTAHDFAKIPQIPSEQGVSIYTAPGSTENNQRQNLYIENTLDKPVVFSFEYKEGDLSLAVSTLE